ncbi:Replication factor A protein 1 [Lunasporangiospora selenospora]|uniref:Replication protein A subunit n=1 Tax=Lunasporangiospora selenospora TaxID=979761 RepID=A0A9P6FMR0_9FUNG|nr:Replication factor A protein 1 [Lunasporangiospora selenospora]
MAHPPLTPNAIQLIFQGEECPSPVLQIVNTKAILPQAAGGATRHRVLFSDGTSLMQGVFGTTIHPLFENGALKIYSIVKLVKYSTKPVNGRKLILTTEIDIVNTMGPSVKLGTPVSVDSGAFEKQGQRDNQGGDAPQQYNNPYQQISSQQQQHQQQQHHHQQQATTTPNGMPVYPINTLNPYQNRWTIMARVTQKSEIKTWSKPGGSEGRLFNMTLMDESGEIKATAFTHQVDEFYNLIEEGKVYFVSNAKIDLAKKQFSNVKNEYEMILQRDTQIIHAPDSGAVPEMRYKFVDLASLVNIKEKETVDVIAVVKEVGELSNNISQKTNRPVIKRDLMLVDTTGFVTRLTLWGNQAETFQIAGSNPVIAFKGVSVSDYGGKSLNAFGGSTFRLNPETKEAFQLKGWFENQGQSTSFQAHVSDFKGNSAPRMTFEDLKQATANPDPSQAVFFEIKGTIVMMPKPESYSYPACPTQGCNKKVIQDNTGWRCEKCNRTYPEPEHRYIMGVNVADHSGQSWLQAFNDVGMLITGRSAGELFMNPQEIKPTFDRATFKSYIFKGKAKQEIFGDNAKIRYTIINATPISWVDESKNLLKQLQEYGV